MAKIREVRYSKSNRQFLYMCPGCGYEHAFGLRSEGAHHEFNMDFDKPTVSPSLLQNFNPDKICHSFLKEGMMQYLGDCHHHLAGKTIELPELEKGNFDFSDGSEWED